MKPVRALKSFLGSGWYEVEHVEQGQYAWSGRIAEIIIPGHYKNLEGLYLVFESIYFKFTSQEQEVKVFVDDVLKHSFRVKDRVEFCINFEGEKPYKIRVETDTIKLSDYSESFDQRSLGLCILSIAPITKFNEPADFPERQEELEYDYRSRADYLDRMTANALLSERLSGKNRVLFGHPDHIYSQLAANQILAELARMGFEPIRFSVGREELDSFIQDAQYRELHPHYYPNDLQEKALEHLIGYKLLDLKPHDRFVDLACENSPLAGIYNRLYRIESYEQDIMFDHGIKGKRIGCDASKMSALVSTGFFKGALLACSLEHFEEDSDTRLFLDLEKTIACGGKVVVIPLYLHSFPFNTTDPLYSADQNVFFDEDIDVYCRDDLNHRFIRFYSPKTIMDRIINKCKRFKFTFYYLENFAEIHPSVYCRFILLAQRKYGICDAIKTIYFNLQSRLRQSPHCRKRA